MFVIRLAQFAPVHRLQGRLKKSFRASAPQERTFFQGVMPGRQGQAANVSLGRRLSTISSLQDSITSSDSDSPAVVELFVGQRRSPLIRPEGLQPSLEQGTGEHHNLQESVTEQTAHRGTTQHHIGEQQSLFATVSQAHSPLNQSSFLSTREARAPPLPDFNPRRESSPQHSLRPIPLSPMLALHRCRLFDWSPTPVVALTPSPDGAYVAAARESGDIEIWRAAAGALGWQCELVCCQSMHPAAHF